MNGWNNYKLDDDVKMPEGQESANLIWTFIKQTKQGTTDFFTLKDIFDWESNLSKCIQNNVEVIKTEEKLLQNVSQVHEKLGVGNNNSSERSFKRSSEESLKYSVSEFLPTQFQKVKTLKDRDCYIQKRESSEFSFGPLQSQKFTSFFSES